MSKLALGLLTLIGVSALADVSPTYQSIDFQIFQVKCMKCHAKSVPSGVDLSTYETLMASKVIVVGDPSKSNLYNAVAKGKMPEGGPPLSTDEVNAIGDWIESGAQND